MAVQDVSSAELDSKRWRISSPRESRVFGVYTCSFREGSLNAYKQAVVRFPLSFTRHLCVPDHRLSSPVSHAKPSRGPRYLVSMPRKSGEEIRKRCRRSRVAQEFSKKEFLLIPSLPFDPNQSRYRCCYYYIYHSE